jgi:predicted DNA-binding antitoxin AbrB/MazE fold protein
MTQNIQAIYENGVLRPLAPLDLPEGSIVEIEIIRILGDSAEFIKNVEKDLAELEESEHKRL